MTMPLISVIVPVHNVEKYLHECAESVLCQTVTDIELILVDDGSTDGSGRICDELAGKDARVRVVRHEKSLGPSAARNAGLDVASGEMVSFVDSDDVLHGHFLELLLQAKRKNGAELVCSDYTREPHGLGVCRNHDELVFRADDAIEDMLYQRRLYCSPWGKLYDRSLFDSLRFKPGIIYEDLDIMPKVFEHCSRIVWLGQRLYYYRRTAGGLLSVFTRRRLDVLDVVDSIYERYKDTALEAASRDRKFSAYYNMLVLNYKHGAKFPDVEERCYAFIKSCRWPELCDGNVRLKNRIGAAVSYLGRRFIRILSKF